MTIKVSDYIVETLVKYGTNVFFGYQGGNISHLIDSIGRSSSCSFVETCNEQAAAYAANAYAQISGNIGVALASSGPGAINLVNGIANAFCDSIPCIFFTGDVNTGSQKKSCGLRQNAFQEIDIVPIVSSITKYSKTVESPGMICEELDKAIEIALSGRPGPVVINLPHDVQRAQIDVRGMDSVQFRTSDCDVDSYARHIVDVINASKRPVFLIGGGLRAKKLRECFNRILDRTPIPVICSLLGLDIVNHNHICYRGVIGDFGHIAANEVMKASDCIVVLGNRMDDRQISISLAKELEKKPFFHIDIDSNVLGNKIGSEEKIRCDLCSFLPSLLNCIDAVKSFDNWLEETRNITIQYDQFRTRAFHPNLFLHDFSKEVECIFAFDVGNNQMHAMQSLFVNGRTRVLTSGGLGAMGYSVPAAIGACFADGANKVISICGDGGLQMNLQELQTIALYNLPINVILLNNAGLGMIYDLQNKLFDGRHFGTTENYGVPDFEKVACAFGFEYVKVRDELDFSVAKTALKYRDRVFVEFFFDIGTSVSMLSI